MINPDENKAQVSQRHRSEWLAFRSELLNPAITNKDLELAKIAKAVADILKIYQEGERKAYGFADGETDLATQICWDAEE